MTLFPKNSSAVNPDHAFKSGDLVLYEQEGKAILGTIRGFKRDKYLVFNQRGRETELTAIRLYRIPGILPAEASTIEAQTAYLTKIAQECTDLASKVNLEELWTFTVDEKGDFSTDDLCQMYYGENTLHEHLALRFALMADQIFFKRKKDTFTPRTPEIVTELKKAEITRQRKSLALQQTLDFFKRRLLDKEIQVPPEANEYIELLENTAAGLPWKDNCQQREVKELLQATEHHLGLHLQGPLEKQAFFTLQQIAHFHPDSNLYLIFYQFPRTFTSIALNEATAIQPSEQEERLDLRNLHTITIDDASTKDMDDALSLVQTETGYQLGIHISDVATFLPAASTLEQEAYQRTTSLYLPDGIIHMLPDILAEDRFSLLQGTVRHALSCLITLDPHYQVIDFKLIPTLIEVKQRLSYEQVNELLEQEEVLLNQLYQIAAGLEAQRLKAGAIQMAKREPGIKINGSGTVSLYEINEQTAAHTLVGELMILANSLMADFASKNHLPMLFRGQDPPDQDIETATRDLPEGPAREYGARGKLKPSNISTAPIPHSSLALTAYLQATSPIRRYSDLINQRQLLSFTRNKKPFYQQEKLEQLIPGLNDQSRAAVLISRKTRRYWLLKYIKQQLRQQPIWTATVVRTDLKMPLVELDELFLTAPIRTPQAIKIGERISVKIVAVDPRSDYIKLEIKS